MSSLTILIPFPHPLYVPFFSPVLLQQGWHNPLHITLESMRRGRRYKMMRKGFKKPCQIRQGDKIFCYLNKHKRFWIKKGFAQSPPKRLDNVVAPESPQGMHPQKLHKKPFFCRQQHVILFHISNFFPSPPISLAHASKPNRPTPNQRTNLHYYWSLASSVLTIS